MLLSAADPLATGTGRVTGETYRQRPFLHNAQVLNQALDGEGPYKEPHYPRCRVAEAF